MCAALNDGYAYRITVQRGGETVLAFLTARFTHSDGAAWAARLAAGEVEVDGRRVAGPEALRPGQSVVWRRPPWAEPDVPLDFGVLYEDGALLAVDKPSGLPTMPAGGFLNHTLLTRVRRRWPGASPLHRLGRGTSGVVLFALSGEAGAALSRSWREHAVHKAYRALASGTVQPDSFSVEAPIGPVAHGLLGTVHAASPQGKAAHSDVRVLERRPGRTLLDVEIRTGRPHQIRIHLAFAGHPLVGDPLYAPGGLPRAALPGLPGDLGYWLHAHRLSFVHPTTGRALEVEAPPPEPLQLQPPGGPPEPPGPV
ncbi:RluA family pseudouridine synthase [Deinococcus koreensis]|uniref:Pseudouridine synthase n=1 Tax=Deinococcus koreensis TaxID=2054903 RepID=A0A2K3UY97_9DEIO|nr:RluA family pseudouridine synthase [Deinococcus koreensis]PNY81507.1 RNA pseudouridine synthase [Deinococcus koreensis]